MKLAMSLNVLPKAPPLREDSSGTLRVGATRVSLESVIWAFQRGATPEQIVEEYPSLDRADVYDVIAYYLRQQDEVDRYLQQQKETTDEAMSRIRREFPQENLRAKLRSRLRR